MVKNSQAISLLAVAYSVFTIGAIPSGFAQNANSQTGSVDSVTNGPSSQPNQGGVDILSDTHGVNFKAYIAGIMPLIYQKWLPLIPDEARPPVSKQGVTLIRFTILPDGMIGAMHLDGSSHDDLLNRAAWDSVTAVGKFPPLPKQFTGPSLELRIHFLVNKTKE